MLKALNVTPDVVLYVRDGDVKVALELARSTSYLIHKAPSFERGFSVAFSPNNCYTLLTNLHFFYGETMQTISTIMGA